MVGQTPKCVAVDLIYFNLLIRM